MHRTMHQGGRACARPEGGVFPMCINYKLVALVIVVVGVVVVA